jgi:hypothetical protein
VVNFSDKDIEDVLEKGDALLLETEECTGEYLHAKDLAKMIRDSKTELDFVFIAACHSEKCANVFFKEC